MVKIGMQPTFGPNNLHDKGFLLHKIFYYINLLPGPFLPNRPKVVLPPRAPRIFWHVLNALNIGNNISKIQSVLFSYFGEIQEIGFFP